MKKTIERHPDLFEKEPTPIVQKDRSMKANMGYRKAVTLHRSCGRCQHFGTMRYHGKNYFKCDLIGYSHSSSSDIRKSGVCNHFVEQ